MWVGIGSFLRFYQLTAKSPWTDEFATLVFSLGNDYQSVPLNQIISLDVLLQPLKVNPAATIGDITSLLLHEDNHPPLYFILAHLWMKLFTSSGEYVSLWAGRSLPALLGVLSIILTYFLAKIAFKSPLVGQLAAALMAVSPYGVFLSQEARHYTLAIIFVIASLICFVIAVKHLENKTIIPLRLAFLWIVINGLGIITHYFFSLTLCAEGIALIALLFLSIKHQRNFSYPARFLRKNWWRLALVTLGTTAVALVWFLAFVPARDGQVMTEWIRIENWTILALINPVFQLFAAWVTMLYILPIEYPSPLIIIISCLLLMLVFFIWVVPILVWGSKSIWKQKKYSLATRIFVYFIISAIAFFFILTYFFKIDITRGARYNFIYFPAVIALLGAILATCWQQGKEFKFWPNNGKIAVSIILFVGFLGGMTVSSNLGYTKYYRPDILVNIIEKNSSVPILITTTHKSLVQTGEMMGIAWELKQQSSHLKTDFLLISEDKKEPQKATFTLQKSLNNLPRPLDLWSVNFQAPLELKNCRVDEQDFPYINGYAYRRYHCPKLAG